MGGIIGLLLLTFLCSSVKTVRGECRQVKNDDLIEYSCVNGQLSDLDSLPASTGKIRISNMPIYRITKDTFSKFGSDLWVLGCSHCAIRDIEPGAFQHLDNLQQLSLDNNYLPSIKESWFRGLNYLTYLDLNYNNIQTIEDGVFRTLPSLVDLRLSGNRLECLNLRDMSNLKELKRIFLTENSEFKCPNAVSAYLTSHGVSFEKDTEWSKIPEDEVYQNGYSDDYDDYYDTTTTTVMPTFRERLHLTTTTTAPPETTPPYLPPRFQTTEDVIYHPDPRVIHWRTTPKPTTTPEPATTPKPPMTTPRAEETYYREVLPYEEETFYKEESPYEEQDIRPYTPPRTIAPLESDRNSQMTDGTQLSVDEATLRSWPILPEPTNVRPEYLPNPPYGNENRHNEGSSDSGEPPLPLAAGPVDGHETPSFVESNVGRTTESQTSNQQQMYLPVNSGGYPVITNSPSILEPMQSRGPDARPPVIHNNPVIIQPPSPDNSYQTPYYEYPVTVHPPPPVYYPVAHMDGTMTTTDKPLPDCPSSSSPIQRSVELIVLSILMVFVRNAFVEGF
ncbi:uncharacterized protein LOC116425603 isoform X1 [Nomia melanderi]|uniref:uncharacterized protein LOC116425603 isoform X1 n=1 Tax=Nomia melanderi TaxID=2448451 RepID=UPI003FCE673E